ncbi:serine dehydratase alpha chain [Clostridium tepidiprofundi DSM 19306]|uniref:UPF0597 protein CLTEP_07550 n=1 Tax=Clostridium tepidiprofundi DSM 19306 TaxID=1121338 RepID=A0A151B5Y3_9CLOT|nr:L-serine ammonia-lyase, iron-sulfur-dependent, subunit alpha [Clostridium tepidiprofundi]KYH35351.1 serine dehydratase alpha chain [Clostridium tepidiprofundi DSM 19306]
MDCSDCRKFIELLKTEVVPALGCTEPIAVALAASKGIQALEKEAESIDVFVSGNILKNGMGVGIPGTGMTGLDIAAALGAIGGNPDAELEVLKDITKEDVNEAVKMVEEGKVTIIHKNVPDKLYIEVICKTKEEYSKVVIKQKHTNIVLIERNGNAIFKDNSSEENVVTTTEDRDFATIDNIHEFAHDVELDDIKFLLESVKLNKNVAKEGLEGDYGLKVGKTIAENVKKGILCDDIQSYAMSLTAAASDARMAGCMCPVMSNSGSGNQGITVTLPIVAVAEKLESSEEKLLRALAIGHLTAIHIKTYLGRLSALCGATVAATGASVGITYLLGGNCTQAKYAIKNMVGNVAGMICDGAKIGCALKVSTCTSAAVQSALLAINDIVISEKEGVIDRDIEKTIKNLGTIATQGMNQTDNVILDIMVSK